jgi:hypothetical protein
MRREPGYEQLDRTAKAGAPRQERQDKRPRQKSQHRRVNTGESTQESKDRRVGTRELEVESRSRITRTGEPGEENQKRSNRRYLKLSLKCTGASKIPGDVISGLDSTIFVGVLTILERVSPSFSTATIWAIPTST